MDENVFETYSNHKNKKERNVNLPKGIIRLSNNAFRGNQKIVKISFNDQCQIIEEEAFKNCKKLKKVYFPLKTELMTIPKSCFENCVNLEQVSIPSSVDVIKAKAFKGCHNIKVLTIPKGVAEIDSDAFMGWDESQEIVIYKDYGDLEDCYASINKMYESKSESKESIDNKESGKRYFTVTCKCGHVSRKKYIPITFAIVAKNRKEAAAIARNLPRVKHNHKYAILQNKEIAYTEYLEIKENNKHDPYLNVNSSYEQKEIRKYLQDRLLPEISDNVHHNKRKKTKKKHYDGKEEIRDFKKYHRYNNK